MYMELMAVDASCSLRGGRDNADPVDAMYMELMAVDASCSLRGGRDNADPVDAMYMELMAVDASCSLRGGRDNADPVERHQQERIICLRTKSDEDVLDDGYKWKKYGQKQIKDRIHHRYYFRCRTNGCPVKKQVERCPDDFEYVLTTYNGIHSHASAISSSLSLQRNAFDLRDQVFGLPRARPRDGPTQEAEAPPCSISISSRFRGG